MYKQSPSRNHRSKGIKVKYVLQICLLVAVCFWLIYQVKHSHDKKKEFDESDAKALLEKGSSDELIRLGRKDIQTLAEGTAAKNENHDELSEEEETNIEVEDNKNEEDEPEDKKVEGMEEDDGTGGGDEETDEHEQERSDVEVDGEPNLVNGEEREDGDEKEIQETGSEDSHGQVENESTEKDPDHDGDDRNAHEAREEHYKADDASSAVTHDTQIVTNENVENVNQHPENILEEENKESDSEENYRSEDRKNLEVEGGEVARDGHQLNVTTSETKVDVVDNSGSGSSLNNTVIEGSDGHWRSNSTTEVIIENHDLPLKSVTESEPELSHVWGNLTESISAEGSHLQTIDSESDNNSILTVDGTHFDSNSTDSAEIKDAELLSETELSNSSNNVTLPSASEDVLIPESSLEAGNNTESSAENNSEVEGEKSDTSDGTDESLETTLTENPEEVQQDAIDGSDTSISMKEKDVRMDLDTLPEIQTEGTNNEDAAAE